MSEIKPAQTEQEWKLFFRRQSNVHLPLPAFPQGNRVKLISDGHGEYGSVYEIPNPKRHEVAAECLHEQPFGFTREDVEHHRRLAGECGNSDGSSIVLFAQMEALSAWHLSMADRIEALLPPENPS